MKWVFRGCAIATYIFLYVPILILAVFSFNDATQAYGWQGFSLRWYRELVHSSELLLALKNSLIIALASVGLAVSMGTALVWYLADRFPRSVPLFYSVVAIPEIVLAIGLLTCFSYWSVPLGYTSLIAGHTLLGLGFVVPIVYARLQELDKRIIEASLDLGATQTQTLVRIVIPFLSPALIAAAMLVFIVSLDNFLISFFCVGASFQTLSLYIFAMIRGGVSPVVNALSVIMIMVSSVLVMLFSLFMARAQE